jgi:hypothetical protein
MKIDNKDRGRNLLNLQNKNFGGNIPTDDSEYQGDLYSATRREDIKLNYKEVFKFISKTFFGGINWKSHKTMVMQQLNEHTGLAAHQLSRFVLNSTEENIANLALVNHTTSDLPTAERMLEKMSELYFTKTITTNPYMRWDRQIQNTQQRDKDNIQPYVGRISRLVTE